MVMTREELERQKAEIAKLQYFLARGFVFREPDETLVTELAAEDLQRWYRVPTKRPTQE